MTKIDVLSWDKYSAILVVYKQHECNTRCVTELEKKNFSSQGDPELVLKKVWVKLHSKCKFNMIWNNF